MIVYAESSAVLAWLLDDGPDGLNSAATLEQATMVIASDLTLIECDRVLSRAAALDEISESDAAERQARLNGAASHWTLIAVEEDVVERARRPFPAEPIRTLDAIHLATALTAKKALPDLAVLSLDRRVRRAATALGFQVIPPAG